MASSEETLSRSRRIRRAAMWVFLLSLVIRLVWAGCAHVTPVSHYAGFHNRAIGLLENGKLGWSDRRAYHTPAYPMFIAAVYALPGDDLRSLAFAQAVLGAMVSGMVVLLGGYAVRSRVAGVAGLIHAIWPTSLAYLPAAASQNLANPFMMAGLLLLASADRRDGWRHYVGIVAAGITLGLMLLARPAPVFLIPPCLLWLLYSPTRRVFRPLSPIVLFVTVTLMLVPWFARNYQLGMGPMRISSVGGVNLWMGNNDRAQDGGTLKGVALPRVGSEAEQDDAHRAAATAWIRDNPGRYLALSRVRLMRMLGVERDGWAARWLVPTRENGDVLRSYRQKWKKGEPIPPEMLSHVCKLVSNGESFLEWLRVIVAPLILVAMVLALARWRAYAWIVPPAICYILCISLYYVMPRYREMSDILLLIPLAALLSDIFAGTTELGARLGRAWKATLAALLLAGSVWAHASGADASWYKLEPREFSTPDASRFNFTPVVIDQAPEAYKSFWTAQVDDARITVTDGALSCNLQGGSDTSKGQYGGVRIPVPHADALRFELAVTSPENVDALIIDGYDGKGRSSTKNRCCRWQWLVHRDTPLPREPAVYTLVPSAPSGHFRPSGESDPDRVAEIHVFLRIDPGSSTGFILRDVAVGRTPFTCDDGYRDCDATRFAHRIGEFLDVPAPADVQYWRDKPALRETLAYPLSILVTDADREIVRRYKQGDFRPSKHFDWRPLGVPPPWDVNPFDNRTFDFYRHSLRWLPPIVKVWIFDGDAKCGELAQRVIADWIRANSKPPGASRYAWNDHAAAYRARIFCWFWELWRRTDAYDPEFAELLLASVRQHAAYLADDANYHPTSNHALFMDGSLLAVALTFPEFHDAARWRGIAEKRLALYTAANFSNVGFNLEQSPSYHWYVLEKLGEVAEFLRENQQPVSPSVAASLDRGLRVWPWLIRPDGAMPNVGDTGHYARRTWPEISQKYLGKPPPSAAPSTLANPRPDGAEFLLCPQAGYAISTSYPSGAPTAGNNTYVLFRCNSWRHSGHCHCDALSFEVFGLGREWLVDSGKLNYEEQSPVRKYMRSARAHNVVLVDNEDFEFCPVNILDSGRTESGDFVIAQHDLRQTRHVRRFEFRPPGVVEIVDELRSADGKPHVFTQLFHVAPGLNVELEAARRARISDGAGNACVIEQLGDEGDWSVITGQLEPYVQGWYSRSFNKKSPSPVIRFSTRRPVRACNFKTRVTLQAK